QDANRSSPIARSRKATVAFSSVAAAGAAIAALAVMAGGAIGALLAIPFGLLSVLFAVAAVHAALRAVCPVCDETLALPAAAPLPTPCPPRGAIVAAACGGLRTKEP